MIDVLPDVLISIVVNLLIIVGNQKHLDYTRKQHQQVTSSFKPMYEYQLKLLFIIVTTSKAVILLDILSLSVAPLAQTSTALSFGQLLVAVMFLKSKYYS